MLRIAICADLPQDREAIRLSLTDGLAALHVAAELTAYDSAQALLSAWETDLDLVFLDLRPTGTVGMQTARRLRERGYRADMVLLSTTAEFAIEGYEVEAAGYLLRPLAQEKLEGVLRRILAREHKPMLTLRQGKSVFTIAPSDIVYIESNRNLLTIHTVNEKVAYYGRLDEIEDRLASRRFLRCHHSFLVNMDRVHAAGDDFRMETGALVPIRVRERRAIREAYFRYITQKSR